MKVQQLARSIMRELIEIDTTDSTGNVTDAARAMRRRLSEAGFAEDDLRILGPNERKGNLVARFRGSGAERPLLLIGHLDVVEASRKDWATDPFRLVEKDDYFYGRGTLDMKGSVAILVTSLILLKREGYRPSRDIILALTADEEGGRSNGVGWLLRNHRELIDAEFVLNPDAGGVYLLPGGRAIISVQAAEKLYADYRLTATSNGGHSSVPPRDNVIYRLANALTRLQGYDFPVELNPLTRASFEQEGAVVGGQTGPDMRALLESPPPEDAVARLSAYPLYNARMRTTCVVTRFEAGFANNALPREAQAVVNCRILPGHSAEEVRQVLARVVADPSVAVRYLDALGNAHDTAPERVAPAPAPLRPDVMSGLRKTAAAIWPDMVIVPGMATGSSDGIYTSEAGMPTYGISGLAIDGNDGAGIHGLNERVRVESYFRGVDFYYNYLKELTAPR